jgi:proline dehydrogenase
MGLVDSAIVRFLPAVPKPVVRRISERYIAGEHLDDALRVVRSLNDQGKLATIDVLGEEIGSPDEARAIAMTYNDSLDAFARGRLESNVSVKPTALGLKLGYDLCKENLEDVVRHAAELGNFVRIDMEDASTTDDTLRLYRELRAAGCENVGVVFQACLKRTLQDIRDLAELRPNVRLCKGIYVEPPEIAYRDFDSIRVSFVQALEELLEAGCYVGIATHDEWLVEQGQRLTGARGLGPEEYEFQLLLGVRPSLGDELVRGGHRLRIYTPFGEHWYAYSLRRLQENPKIAGYIAADTVGRLIRGRNGSGPSSK